MSEDSLFETAVELAVADGQISAGTLQLRLRMGYARAGRLLDDMEKQGIIGAQETGKPRKCLITREKWEEIRRSSES